MQVQHSDAKRLLRVLQSQVSKGQMLTYGTAAVGLGRPPNHARAVAQVCDLLDAAAALMRVPLLALVWVKDANGKINCKAWSHVPPGIKERIVRRSLAHKFQGSDFSAIEEGLNSLAGLGNRAAWRRVHKIFGGEANVAAIVSGEDAAPTDNAIDDIGSDRPTKVSSSGFTYQRDSRVRQAVIERAGGRCELCGELGFLKEDGDRYIEAHHIIALANDGADRMTNVIALCANHHRQAHFGKDASFLEKRMMGVLSKLI